jgi:parvulin-like peptidyl-prolyl isomerase
MLQSMRRSGASIFIYLIFGILILVFVLNFGPQAGRDTGGCTGRGANTALTIDGSEISRVAYGVPEQISEAPQGVANPRAAKTAQVFEWLIRRELLAQEAESRGMRVSDDAVDEEIKRGSLFFDGRRENIKKNLFDEVDGKFFFNYKNLQNVVERKWQISMNAFKDAQKREMLASMMADLIRSGVQVSRDEALQQFLYENNTVTFDAVKFQPAVYLAAMKLTEDDIARFVAGHEADIKAKFAVDERLYKGVKPQILVRQIFLEKPAPAPIAPPPAAGSGSGAAPVAPAVVEKDKALVAFEASVAKLEIMRADIAAGKAKFADVAKSMSTDDASKFLGGSLGWRTVESPQVGDTVLNDAVKALKVGDVSAVLTTDRGVYLFTVEAKREGDLKFDQVKQELAVAMAKDVWSKEAAKRAAIAALVEAKIEAAKPLDAKGQKGKSLNELYDRERMSPDIELQRILNDPTMPQDQKQRMLQEYLKMRQPTGRTGRIVLESDDVQVSWLAAQQAAGSAGSAAGSASGSAATPAITPPPPPAPVVESMVASNDKLPEFGTIAKASVTRLGPVPRSNRLPDFGENKALVGLLFDKLTSGGLADTIFDAQGSYAIVQLVERAQPDMKEFDKKAVAMMQTIKQRRSGDALMGWLKERCDSLNKAGKIKPAPDLLREVDDKGNPMPTQYKPCMSYGRDEVESALDGAQ